MILVQLLLFCGVSFGSYPRPGFNRRFQENNDQETKNGNGPMTAFKTCPDADLQAECDALCRTEYNRCRLLCETEYCQSICDREYQICRDNCPCGANCEDGCINCDSSFCPTTTTIVTTTTIDQNMPSNVHILVFGYEDLGDSYIFSGDGLTKSSPNIFAPQTDYMKKSVSAIVKGEMYIFGTLHDDQKIAKLTGCSINELPIRLVNQFSYGAAAIDIDDGERALICHAFPKPDYNSKENRNCDIFDTTSAIQTHSMQYPHWYGGLGYYQGQPTTVSGDGFDGWQKVETYNESTGWTSLADHPRIAAGHTLTGLDSGAMLMVGGFEFDWETRDIWLLKEDVWTLIGELKEYNEYGSALKISDFIYIVSGVADDSNGLHPVERIQLISDEEIKTEVIGAHDFLSYTPVILEATADFCV